MTKLQYLTAIEAWQYFFERKYPVKFEEILNSFRPPANVSEPQMIIECIEELRVVLRDEINDPTKGKLHIIKLCCDCIDLENEYYPAELNPCSKPAWQGYIDNTDGKRIHSITQYWEFKPLSEMQRIAVDSYIRFLTSRIFNNLIILNPIYELTKSQGSIGKKIVIDINTHSLLFNPTKYDQDLKLHPKMTQKKESFRAEQLEYLVNRMKEDGLRLILVTDSFKIELFEEIKNYSHNENDIKIIEQFYFNNKPSSLEDFTNTIKEAHIKVSNFSNIDFQSYFIGRIKAILKERRDIIKNSPSTPTKKQIKDLWVLNEPLDGNIKSDSNIRSRTTQFIIEQFKGMDKLGW